MAASERKKTPDFFDEIDPIDAAVRSPTRKTKKTPKIPEPQKTDTDIETRPHVDIEEKTSKKKTEPKVKVGYYFKAKNMERFDQAHLKIQLEKIWKGKISEFMEAILEFGLDDLESSNSKIMKRLSEQR
jgi:hypothetical protein